MSVSVSVQQLAVPMEHGSHIANTRRNGRVNFHTALSGSTAEFCKNSPTCHCHRASQGRNNQHFMQAGLHSNPSCWVSEIVSFSSELLS